MRKLLVLVIFNSLVASSVSLKCYNCMSSDGGNCEDTAQMQVKECEISASASSSLHAQPVCLKVVKDIRGFDHITKSCTFSGSLLDPCKQHLSAQHCSTCDTNLCNKSSNFFINSFFIFIAVLSNCLHVFHRIF
ncbi:unnamed protein product [Chironomus riparius]|uniref:Protein sleepless n=1 Tax=Chironomus riparius TaxID=315576 RepID=A0A9N9RRF8_9DIPT|nr:unnamed protein product [Chironomus riparius]